MYLLMLLATFVSAIYGYNLSARPDYDRDVPRKKATAVIQRFLAQHDAAIYLTKDIESEFVFPSLKAGVLPWIMPEDKIYAADRDGTEDEGTVLTYKPSDGGEGVDFYARLYNRKGQEVASELKQRYIRHGMVLHGKTEMTSKIICFDEPYLHLSSGMCTPETDEDGNTTKSCCTKSRYLISYMPIDPRWVNKITRGISFDLLNGLAKYEYKHNIGVISRQNDEWLFQGKTDNYSSYYKDMDKWNEDHKDSEEAADHIFPYEMMRKNRWILPNNVFTRYFFENADGANDICDYGCLFRIQGI